MSAIEYHSSKFNSCEYFQDLIFFIFLYDFRNFTSTEFKLHLRPSLLLLTSLLSIFKGRDGRPGLPGPQGSQGPAGHVLLMPVPSHGKNENRRMSQFRAAIQQSVVRSFPRHLSFS